MVRKKIDNRIRILIENGVALGHRTMFIVVGDKGRDQVKLVVVLGCVFVRIMNIFFQGGPTSSHVVKSQCEISSHRSMVLQERTRIQQVSLRYVYFHQVTNASFAACTSFCIVIGRIR